MSRNGNSFSQQLYREFVAGGWVSGTENDSRPSRHEAKKILEAQGEAVTPRAVSQIARLSPDTYKAYTLIYKDLQSFCKENFFSGGRVSLYDLRADHVTSFIESRCSAALAAQEQGKASPGAARMQNIISACNKLEAVLPKQFEGLCDKLDTMRHTVAKDLRAPAAEVRRYDNPAAVISNLSGRSRLVAEIQYKTGLRVDNARSFTILGDNKIGFYSKGHMDHFSKPFALPADLYARALEFNGGKEGRCELVPYRTYLHHLETACGKAGERYSGSHSFRHSYAYERYNTLRAEGKNDVRARAAVSQELFHQRIDVVNVYIDR